MDELAQARQPDTAHRCCWTTCNKAAEFRGYYGKPAYDHYTEGCGQHIYALLNGLIEDGFNPAEVRLVIME